MRGRFVVLGAFIVGLIVSGCIAEPLEDEPTAESEWGVTAAEAPATDVPAPNGGGQTAADPRVGETPTKEGAAVGDGVSGQARPQTGKPQPEPWLKLKSTDSTSSSN